MTSTENSDPPPGELQRRRKRMSPRRYLAPVAVGFALLSALLTLMVLTGLTPIEPTPRVVRSFLLVNAGTILLLLGLIIREVWHIMQARRRGQIEPLHLQLVGLFALFAVLPGVAVAIVANVTIERGFNRLFSGPTREVIQNSVIIARAYTYEHAQLIRGDILGMAIDISHARPLFDQDRVSFNELLTASASARDLPGAMLIDKDRNVLASAATGSQQSFTTPPVEFLSNVNESEPQIAVFPEANYVAAVVRQKAFPDTFLCVARLLDPRVVAQLKQTEASAAEYAELESRRLAIQVNVALMFAVIALTILMASGLTGLNIANRLMARTGPRQAVDEAGRDSDGK